MKKSFAAIFLSLTLIILSGCLSDKNGVKSGEKEGGIVITRESSTNITKISYTGKMRAISVKISENLKPEDILSEDNEFVIVRNTSNGTIVNLVLKPGETEYISFRVKNRVGLIDAELVDAIDEKNAKIAGVTKKAEIQKELLGDFNNDGTVNLFDFMVFSGAYGTKESRCDIAPAEKGTGLWQNIYCVKKPDGEVNLFDFMVFVNNYGTLKPADTEEIIETPIIVSIPTMTIDSAVVKWTKSANADKYELYRSIDGKSYEKVAETNLTEIKDVTLEKGKSYYYKVKAINTLSGKVSELSDCMGISTPGSGTFTVSENIKVFSPEQVERFFVEKNEAERKIVLARNAKTDLLAVGDTILSEASTTTAVAFNNKIKSLEKREKSVVIELDDLDLQEIAKNMGDASFERTVSDSIICDSIESNKESIANAIKKRAGLPGKVDLSLKKSAGKVEVEISYTPLEMRVVTCKVTLVLDTKVNMVFNKNEFSVIGELGFQLKSRVTFGTILDKDSVNFLMGDKISELTEQEVANLPIFKQIFLVGFVPVETAIKMPLKFFCDYSIAGGAYVGLDSPRWVIKAGFQIFWNELTKSKIIMEGGTDKENSTPVVSGGFYFEGEVDVGFKAGMEVELYYLGLYEAEIKPYLKGSVSTTLGNPSASEYNLSLELDLVVQPGDDVDNALKFIPSIKKSSLSYTKNLYSMNILSLSTLFPQMKLEGNKLTWTETNLFTMNGLKKAEKYRIMVRHGDGWDTVVSETTKKEYSPNKIGTYKVVALYDFVGNPYPGPKSNEVDVGEVIVPKDKNLEAVLREALKQPEGSIFKEHVEATYLDNGANRGIKTLEGLEKLNYIYNRWNLSGNQLTSLKGLEGLKCVSDYLDLRNNQLTNVDALTNLTKVSDGVIYLSNNALTNVNGLCNLSEGRIELHLENNKLTSVTGLKKLVNVWSLNLSNNLLTNVDGLNNLTTVDYYYGLNLSNNQLTNVDGLCNLKTVFSDIDLTKNQLTNVDGLSKLEKAMSIKASGNKIKILKGMTKFKSGHLDFSDNQITSISGFDSMETGGMNFSNNAITSIEGFDLLKDSNLKFANNKLTTVKGFNMLNCVYDDLDFSNNQLISIDGFKALKTIGRSLNLSNNKLKSIKGFDVLERAYYIDLRNNELTNIDNFNALKSVVGIDLTNNQLTAIDGFNALESVSYLSIYQFSSDENKLETLNGFNSLKSVNRIEIEYAKTLKSIKGLKSLTTIEGDLHLDDTQLNDISGLKNLTKVGGTLNLSGNKLTNADGLASLTSVGKDFDMSGNSMTNVDGLKKLINVGGSLYLIANQLTSVKGLSALTKITNSIYLNSNKLTDLEGLNGLTSVGKDLMLHSNKLTNVNELKSLTSVGGELDLYNNKLENVDGLSGITKCATLDLSGNRLFPYILYVYPEALSRKKYTEVAESNKKGISKIPTSSPVHDDYDNSVYALANNICTNDWLYQTITVSK